MDRAHPSQARTSIGRVGGSGRHPRGPFAFGAIAAPKPAVDKSDADALLKAAASASTGAVITVTDGDRVESYGSGTARAGAKDDPTAEHRFRVGSNTKMFVATVVLQLVQEGKLALDGPIGDYLPGVVKGEGIDEKKITVRQLLQHTSGLADYDTDIDLYNPIYQVNPPTPEEIAGLGLRHGSQATPGSTFAYANTNYIVLGLLIEKVTGTSVGEAMDERIVRPLDLEQTHFADTGEKTMEDPHFRGYVGLPFIKFDVTALEPGLWWAAGALVSSGSDLNTFTAGLLGGKLLDDTMLGEMKKAFGEEGYGLGLMEVKTDCGKAWGHNGLVPGYFSLALTDGKGRSVYAAANTYPNDIAPVDKEMLRITNEALCGTGDTGSESESEAPPLHDRSMSRPPSLDQLVAAGFRQVGR